MGYRTQHLDGIATILPQEAQCLRQLWATVVTRAISDLRGNGAADPDSKAPYAEQRGLMKLAALSYFASPDTHVGSFVWISRVLGFDTERARTRLLNPHTGKAA